MDYLERARERLSIVRGSVAPSEVVRSAPLLDREISEISEESGQAVSGGASEPVVLPTSPPASVVEPQGSGRCGWCSRALPTGEIGEVLCGGCLADLDTDGHLPIPAKRRFLDNVDLRAVVLATLKQKCEHDEPPLIATTELETPAEGDR
jgi:hypothetical protein